MQVNNLKDLESVIKLCRRMGVLSIEISGIKLQLSDEAPAKKLKTEQQPEAKDEPMYTDEQMMMWSSAGING